MRVVLIQVIVLVVVLGHFESLVSLVRQNQRLAERGLAEVFIQFVGSLRSFLGANPRAGDCYLLFGVFHPLRNQYFVIFFFDSSFLFIGFGFAVLTLATRFRLYKNLVLGTIVEIANQLLDVLLASKLLGQGLTENAFQESSVLQLKGLLFVWFSLFASALSLACMNVLVSSQLISGINKAGQIVRGGVELEPDGVSFAGLPVHAKAKKIIKCLKQAQNKAVSLRLILNQLSRSTISQTQTNSCSDFLQAIAVSLFWQAEPFLQLIQINQEKMAASGAQANKSRTDIFKRSESFKQQSISLGPAQQPNRAKFVIRYEDRETREVKSTNKISKMSYGEFRNKRSESLSDPNKLKNKNNKNLPSYLKPTQSYTAGQTERELRLMMVEKSLQSKTVGVLKVKSRSFFQEQEGEQEYNRVPIQYNDERLNGLGVQSIKARVVYRGYAPKNAYFYLKTIKSLKRRTHRRVQNSETNTLADETAIPTQGPKNQHDIRFDSKFESGNLAAAARVSATEYWLYMREDTNTHGLRQWYYFAVYYRKSLKLKFRIYKFTKNYSLYRQGMKPYIRVTNSESNLQSSDEWCQAGEKVRYDYDHNQKCYYLEFEYKFEEDSYMVQFSMLPPYTYSMMREYLNKLETVPWFGPSRRLSKEHKSETNFYNDLSAKDQPYCKYSLRVEQAGQSLAGLSIPVIQLVSTLSSAASKPKQREAIIILSRIHPSETVSNFALESFIDTLLDSPRILDFYDFFILPMVNPDGVYFGNHRTSVMGQDLNRNFHTADLQVFPEIEAVNNVVNRVRKTHKVGYLIDLHGHSARKNIFAYGDQHEIGSAQHLHSRILPKLLSQATSAFRYDYCVFRQCKQKKHTARVHFNTRFRFPCLTVEQSYGLIDSGAIGIHIWRSFGKALAQSLLVYAHMCESRGDQGIEDCLKEEIATEKQQIAKRLERHRKMLRLGTEGKGDTARQAIDLTQKAGLPQQVVPAKQQMYKQEQRQKKYQQSIINKYNGQQQDQEKSVNMSQLSSGDESLQLKSEELQSLKKQIIRTGCLKQGPTRVKYNVADKKLQLYQSSQYPNRKQPHTARLHEHKSTTIPRLSKFQLQFRKKEEYNFSLKKELMLDQLDKERQERRIEIENRFRKMELPSIRK